MSSYKVAHIREQGVDVVIIPLDSSFGQKMEDDQHAIIAEFQARCIAAHLAGNVVVVWDAGGGRMAFIAPPNQHSFFKSINLQWVFANLNRDLYW